LLLVGLLMDNLALGIGVGIAIGAAGAHVWQIEH
jgi:hypothetical protein